MQPGLVPIPADFVNVLPCAFADPKERALFLKIYFLLPLVSFEVTPIANLKLVATPFTRLLFHKPREGEEFYSAGGGFSSFQTGFLMIEGRKRVVPLAANDPFIWEAPLVGVWTYGLELPEALAGAEMNRFEKEELKASLLRNPLVWAALCRFLFCRHFQMRYSASQGKNTFLLINFFKNS